MSSYSVKYHLIYNKIYLYIHSAPVYITYNFLAIFNHPFLAVSETNATEVYKSIVTLTTFSLPEVYKSTQEIEQKRASQIFFYNEGN